MTSAEFWAAFGPAILALAGAATAYLKARSAHQRIDQHQQGTDKKT